MQELEKKSVALRCTCGNVEFEFTDPITDESILRCPTCERVFVFAELRDRVALEAYDPLAALAVDDVAAAMRERDIRVERTRFIDRPWKVTPK